MEYRLTEKEQEFFQELRLQIRDAEKSVESMRQSYLNALLLICKQQDLSGDYELEDWTLKPKGKSEKESHEK